MSRISIRRIRPILLAVYALMASNNLFFVLIPIILTTSNYSPDKIGLAMSVFALGAICAGLFGSKAVRHVGHVRAFASMAGMLSIISVLHSFVFDLWFTASLRFIAGFCFVTCFITLESWLNVLSDKSTRGKTLSIYQLCAALGFGTAPFVINLLDVGDPRLFGIIGLFLCSAIIVMSMSRIPTPEIPDSSEPMKLNKIWQISPSGTVSAFCAGLINAPSVTLISLYAYDHGITGMFLPLVFGSYQLGGLITQYPTGWLADRYDKRSVAAGLMIMGVISNLLIIIEYYVSFPLPVLIGLFLISGGSGIALYPLAVTQVFDHISPKDAMPVTGTLQIIMGCGAFLGPIIAGNLMNIFSPIWLYFYVMTIHSFVAIFLITRKIYIRTETLHSTFPYQVNAQPLSLSGTDLESENVEIANRELKLLVLALEQSPKKPKKIIYAALETSSIRPAEATKVLLLAYPKRTVNLLTHFIELYPAEHLEIAEAAIDLAEDDKLHITEKVADTLLANALPADEVIIKQLISSILSKTSN